jgi:hypothetical protein
MGEERKAVYRSKNVQPPSPDLLGVSEYSSSII